MLFSKRGCCHFTKIFSVLFPHYTSIDFQTSRNAYTHPSQEYIDYVRSIYSKNALIIDEHGRGISCSDFFSKHLKEKATYISIVNDWTSNHYMTHRFGDHIEMLNFDLAGSLRTFDAAGPVLLPVEYDIENVKPAHACIHKCTQLLENYSVEKECDKELLKKLLSKLQYHRPVLGKYLKINHPK